MTERGWLEFLTRPTLRRRLIIGVTGVHAILMISFVADLVDRQKQFLLQRIRERAVQQSGLLAASAVPQLITNDVAGLQDILQALAHDTGIKSAWVTDAEGRILGHSSEEMIGLYLLDTRQKQVLEGPKRAGVFHEAEDTVYAAAPVLVGDQALGWAWVAGDLLEGAAERQAVRRAGIIYTILAIASGALMAILLANRVTHQLRLLLAGTRRLAGDNLTEPVPVTSDDEVGTVARAFNEAMQKLAEQRAELLRARRELETEVEERRRAEEDLTNANRAILSANDSLRRFAYAASHDLQEPLRAVTGYSDLLVRRYAHQLDSDAREFIGYIQQGSMRMQRLIRGLLEYSRAGEAGDKPAAQVDVNAALAEALDNLQTAIEESGARVAYETLPAARVHHVALVQLFQNLVGNAIKYSGGGNPEISVRALRDGRCWRFGVSDNGIGIPPEMRARVFDIFRRAHGDEYPGAGVGLAICSKLVEQYGGRIWVESEVGKGSTFWFTVPAA